MVLKAINDRCSVRSYSDREIPDEMIKNILEAGRLAPSWGNVQPWHFVVVKDPETKELLSKLSYGQPHVAKAPVVIACCGDMRRWEKESLKKILEARPGITEERINGLLNNPAFSPELKGMEALKYRTIEQLTYSIAYMTLEVQNQGIGAVIVGLIGNELTESLPDVYKQVREKLGLPDKVMLITLLALGYPADNFQKPPKVRQSFEEIVSYERYGNKSD